jgi:hypothetical protein
MAVVFRLPGSQHTIGSEQIIVAGVGTRKNILGFFCCRNHPGTVVVFRLPGSQHTIGSKQIIVAGVGTRKNLLGFFLLS